MPGSRVTPTTWVFSISDNTPNKCLIILPRSFSSADLRVCKRAMRNISAWSSLSSFNGFSVESQVEVL